MNNVDDLSINVDALVQAVHDVNATASGRGLTVKGIREREKWLDVRQKYLESVAVIIRPIRTGT